MEDIKKKYKMISFPTFSHPHFKKGKTWTIILILFFLILTFLFFYFKQYFLAIISLIFILVVYIYAKTPPLKLTCKISHQGVKIGEKFYPYNKLRAFWIAYTKPATLYLEKLDRFNPHLHISLKKQDPESLRKILLKHLPERPERGEDLRDIIIRLFKL